MKRGEILRPSMYKIVLTFVISLFALLGWFAVLKEPTLWKVTFYIIFTLLWIVFSGVASSALIHFAKHSRMARVMGFVIISVACICVWTLGYAILF